MFRRDGLLYGLFGLFGLFGLLGLLDPPLLLVLVGLVVLWTPVPVLPVLVPRVVPVPVPVLPPVLPGVVPPGAPRVIPPPGVPVLPPVLPPGLPPPRPPCCSHSVAERKNEAMRSTGEAAKAMPLERHATPGTDDGHYS